MKARMVQVIEVRDGERVAYFLPDGTPMGARAGAETQPAAQPAADPADMERVLGALANVDPGFAAQVRHAA